MRRLPASACLVCGALAVSQGACEEVDQTVGQGPMIAPVVKKATPAEEKPAAPQEETYVYTPVGKRDPFRSYLADLAAERATQATPRKISPTEEYAIDQYRLTGVITGTSQAKAMVEDPQGRGHVLQVGSRLGKNGGRITQITSGTVVVVEEMRTPTGERLRVPITLRLPKEEFELLAQ